MEIVRLIFSPVWKLWFFISFALPFLILFPLFYGALILGKIRFAFALKKVWAACICILSGIIPVIKYNHGKYSLPKNCVIVSNHTSYLDIVLSVFYIKHTALYMGKSELLKIPLFNNFFKYMDIPVNRKSKMESHKAFTDANKKIDEGYSMIIYPEGTISNEGVLKTFKNGAFKMAIEKQVPIVPVVCLNNWKLLQNGGFFKSFGRPGLAKIIVGRPIDTTGLTEENLVDLREQARTFILDELLKYNAKHNGKQN